MTTQEVANRLVLLCREGKIAEAGAEFYAENIISIEPDHGLVKSANGLLAVQEKGRQLAMAIEERHDGSFSDPLVGGKYFAISMMLDATFKGMGRMKLEEICIYEVKEGKIVREEFFY